MKIREYLTLEFDVEMNKTRAALERIPGDKAEFTPHVKSMPFGKLAAHVTDLLSFGQTVLTQPGLDFGSNSMSPTKFESGSQLAEVLNERAAALRGALSGMEDAAWAEPWKLGFHGRQIYEGVRFHAYREMFMNHHIHHRAQLTVYLRLNAIAVPWMFGPTADEPWKG